MRPSFPNRRRHRRCRRHRRRHRHGRHRYNDKSNRFRHQCETGHLRTTAIMVAATLINTAQLQKCYFVMIIKSICKVQCTIVHI